MFNTQPTNKVVSRHKSNITCPFTLSTCICIYFQVRHVELVSKIHVTSRFSLTQVFMTAYDDQDTFLPRQGAKWDALFFRAMGLPAVSSHVQNTSSCTLCTQLSYHHIQTLHSSCYVNSLSISLSSRAVRTTGQSSHPSISCNCIYFLSGTAPL